MVIKIHQRGGDKFNNQIYYEAVEYFIERLVPREYHDDLVVKVIMSKLLKDRGVHDEIDLQNHVIQIDRRMPFHVIISTLAHEVIHLKQVVTGELVTIIKDDDTVEWYWRGDYIGSNLYDHIPSSHHATVMPWEEEAYRLETSLAKEFGDLLFNGLPRELT